MFRLWARTFQNNHMLNDTVICDDREETRTHKVFDAKTRFRQDSFVEEIDFDYLEIQVIEED